MEGMPGSQFGRVPKAVVRRLRMAQLRRRFGFIGSGTWIGWPIDLLTEPNRIRIGERVHIRSHVRLEAVRATPDAEWGRIVVGDGTTMEGYCSISAAESVEIGSSVLFGANVSVRDHDHGFEETGVHRGDQPLTVLPVRIGDFAWLGQNVVVTKGATIGRGAVVGANAVVTGVIPDGAIVAGVPARQIGWADGRSFQQPDLSG
jgi:Acetyltransferase (isoleucine patch superfamily)